MWNWPNSYCVSFSFKIFFFLIFLKKKFFLTFFSNFRYNEDGEEIEQLKRFDDESAGKVAGGKLVYSAQKKFVYILVISSLFTFLQVVMLQKMNGLGWSC